MPLPFKIGGRVTLRVEAEIPTDRPGELRAYRVRGTVSLPRLTLEDLALDEVTTTISLRDGVLRLDELSARLADPADPKSSGTLRGTASLGVSPATRLTAKLTLDRLPIAQLVRIAPDLAAGSEGVVSGDLDLDVPSWGLRTVATWKANARLSSDKARLFGLALRNFRVDAALAAGALTLSRLHADVEGATIRGSAGLKLDGDYPFTGKLDLGRTDLAALDRLIPNLRLPVRLAGELGVNAELKGTLRPLTFRTSGSAAAHGLAVADFPIDDLKFRWASERDRLVVDGLQARLFEGEITGSAAIPLAGEAAGEAALKLKGVDFGAALKRFPEAKELRVEGKAEGSVAVTIPAAKAGGERAVQAEVDLSSPKLRVRNVPFEKLKGSANYRAGLLSYKLSGNALGGEVTLDGDLPLAAPEPKKDAPEPGGRLRIDRVRLGRLLADLGLTERRDVRALLSVDLPYRFVGPERRLQGRGMLRLERFRWKGQELGQVVQADVLLSHSQLRVANLSTSFPQGRARGTVVVDLADAARSRAALTLEQVPAAFLLQLVDPELAESIDATIDARIHTSLGDVIRGRATVGVARGEAFGVGVADLRLPVEWEIVPAQSRAVVTVRDLSGLASRGRMSGEIRYEQFGGWSSRLTGGINFANVDAQALFRGSNLGSFGVGAATGRLDLGGTDLRSVADLTANLRATLGPSQPLTLPVFRDLVPFLGGVRSSQVPFDRSEVRARLARGVWRVERLALIGRQVLMLITGTMTLEGRLDLDVIATTGNRFLEQRALATLATRLPVGVVPLPATLVLDVSRYLSNRTVHLDVTGTVRSPVIRVNTLRLLRDEAVRFFLDRTVYSALPTGVP